MEIIRLKLVKVTPLQKLKKEIKPREGYIVRYRDKTGRYSKFDKRKKLRVEYYKIIYKQERVRYKKLKKETKKLKIKKAVVDEWVDAQVGFSSRVSTLIEHWSSFKGIDKKKIHFRKIFPIKYKYMHQDTFFLNDKKKFNEGNYVIFFILVAVENKKRSIDVLPIRKTVLLLDWVSPLNIDVSMFDDLGKDYVRRSASFWVAPEISPQVANVEYIGWVAYSIQIYDR